MQKPLANKGTRGSSKRHSFQLSTHHPFIDMFAVATGVPAIASLLQGGGDDKKGEEGWTQGLGTIWSRFVTECTRCILRALGRVIALQPDGLRSYQHGLRLLAVEGHRMGVERPRGWMKGSQGEHLVLHLLPSLLLFF